MHVDSDLLLATRNAVDRHRDDDNGGHGLMTGVVGQRTPFKWQLYTIGVINDIWGSEKNQ